MIGEEVFYEDFLNWPATDHKKTSVAETFDHHPSDQSRAFKYFINHIFDYFHEFVENNLQWWEDCDLMERADVAIEEQETCMAVTTSVLLISIV